MEDRPGDSNAALHSHSTSQEQGAQAKEHHTRPKDGAYDLIRIKILPFLFSAVHKKHQGSINEVTQQICDHQAAGKQQEGRPGLCADAAVGFQQNKQSEAVGEDANSHRDY